jgi:hypothetical protein
MASKEIASKELNIDNNISIIFENIKKSYETNKRNLEEFEKIHNDEKNQENQKELEKIENMMKFYEANYIQKKELFENYRKIYQDSEQLYHQSQAIFKLKSEEIKKNNLDQENNNEKYKKLKKNHEYLSEIYNKFNTCINEMNNIPRENDTIKSTLNVVQQTSFSESQKDICKNLDNIKDSPEIYKNYDAWKFDKPPSKLLESSQIKKSTNSADFNKTINNFCNDLDKSIKIVENKITEIVKHKKIDEQNI